MISYCRLTLQKKTVPQCNLLAHKTDKNQQCWQGAKADLQALSIFRNHLSVQ